MLSSLLNRQLTAFATVDTTGVGPVSVTGLTPDADSYAGMASGASGYVPAGACLLTLYVGADVQSATGVGPVGWVGPR